MFYLLVVDDEANHRRLLQVILTSLGHDVWTVDNGQRALLHLATYPIALVVADLEMSDTDGITFITELKQRFPQLIIIALSTNAARGIEALEVGADMFIEKPFSYHELILAVGTVLSKTLPNPPSVE